MREVGLEFSGTSTGSRVAQVNARVVVEVVSNDVDTRVEPGAATECCVAGLLVQVVGGEHERFVRGEALGLVDRHGVAVVEVAGIEVAGRHDSSSGE
jgi:DNA mismatch repair protein MutH